MGYYVRYGFGADEKELRDKFLNSGKSYGRGDFYITDGVCFARFLGERQRVFPYFIKSPLYYSLSCNGQLLIDLVKWIKNLNSGITVEIVKTEYTGKLVCFDKRRVGYSYELTHRPFKFSEEYLYISKGEPIFNQIESGLSIYRCAVKIIVDSENLRAKSYLEYITMITLRILDYLECSLKYFTGKLSIEKDVVKGSNDWHGGHSIYDYLNYKITVEQLKKVLSVKNMEKVVHDKAEFIVEMERTPYRNIASNFIINLILDRK